jgi:hypothetical protein
MPEKRENEMFKKLWYQANASGSGSGGGTGQAAGQNAGQAAGQGTGQAAGQGTGQPPATFETWLEKQDETVKGLLDGHVKGLKTALDSERESRKDLEKQLRDLAKKAETGSDAQTKLTTMADQLAASDRKADFYDAAHKAGVSNLSLAYLAASEKGLIDNKGRVNFDEMKKDFPELFGGKPVPDGNAGSGTEGAPGGAANDMNARIRRAAGRSLN